MANRNLSVAKKNMDDEFYTELQDIIGEIVQHKDYVRQFQGKTVLCNCDDPEWSAFVEFFRAFFSKLGLKKVICTHFEPDGKPSYKLEWSGKKLTDNTLEIVKTPLQGNGDFRSHECIALLEEADIVVTNPPFSIAREAFLPLLYEYGKKFVLIGDLNWPIYRDIFPLFKEGKMFFGYRSVKEFRVPDGKEGKNVYVRDGVTYEKFGNKVWYTNLDLDKHHEPLVLTKNYTGNEDKYPRCENYDAIECKYLVDVPKDYFGVIAVPVTYLSKHCPEQFNIIWQASGNTRASAPKEVLEYLHYRRHDLDRGGCCVVNGTRKYSRILIQRKVD